MNSGTDSEKAQKDFSAPLSIQIETQQNLLETQPAGQFEFVTNFVFYSTFNVH